MISGGLSGGSTGADVSIAYLVNLGLDIADIIQAVAMYKMAVAAFAMGGPVGIAICVVITAMIVRKFNQCC